MMRWIVVKVERSVFHIGAGDAGKARGPRAKLACIKTGRLGIVSS